MSKKTEEISRTGGEKSCPPPEAYDILNDKKLLDDINNAFIKKLKTDRNYYIYDVNTNEICSVEKIIWDLLPDIDTGYKAEKKG